MIRYGPAGIPLSCKGRTLKDGIEDVHNLCLTALEVQLVRPRVELRPAEEDIEVKLTLDQLGMDSEFVIGIERDGEYIYDRDVPIYEDDNLMQVLVPPSVTFGELPRLGKIARRHDIMLSSHTPYYMDLTANLEDEDDPDAGLTFEYLENIKQAGLITNALGGDIVVTNAGPYNEKIRTREETEENILNNIAYVVDFWQEYGLTPKLGIEITGGPDVFGSEEQVFELCDDIPGGTVVPVLNFAHYHARYGGYFRDANDFMDVIYRFAEFGKGHVWSSFSNVEFDPQTNTELYLTPLKKGDLKFEKLADALAEANPDITIISSSPLLEHDAVYMRTLTERVLSKKAAKILKEKKKAMTAEAVPAE